MIEAVASADHEAAVTVEHDQSVVGLAAVATAVVGLEAVVIVVVGPAAVATAVVGLKLLRLL